MSSKKITEISDEFCEDYHCKCGGRVVDGWLDPNGDYDDWIEKPYCEICNMKSRSNKNPYRVFVPNERLNTKYVFIRKYNNGEKQDTLITNSTEVPPADSGGTMYSDGVIVSSPIPIIYRDGETEEEFEMRAWHYAESIY